MTKIKAIILKPLIAFLFVLSALKTSSAQSSLDSLYDMLSKADAKNAKNIELEIKLLLELSGSVSIDFIYQKGDAAFEAGNYEVAVGHYSAVVEFAPDFPLGWSARSRANVQLGYYGPALRDLEKALSLDPRNFFTIMELGRLFVKLGRSDLSVRAVERVLEVHPNFEPALQFKRSFKQDEIDKQI